MKGHNTDGNTLFMYTPIRIGEVDISISTNLSMCWVN